MNKLNSRLLAALLTIALLLTLMPTAVLAADDATVIATSETEYTIDADGVYQLEEGAAAAITISAGVTDVTIIGCGVEYDADEESDTFATISSTPNAIHVDCTAASGIHLTLQDLYNSVTTNTANVFDFSGEDNTLTLTGTCVLDYDVGYTSANDANIHVGVGTSLTIDGDGSAYLYNCTQGAGIGGVTKEMNGDITFSMEGCLFIKGTKQGAVIGAGANASSSTDAPGGITFNSGIYNVITNSRGAAIGGSAGSNGGSTGTTVYLNGGVLSVNTDFSGAAVGGGGYAQGNDSSGGTMYVSGGSLRPYVDKNAANNATTGWNGKTLTEGVNDAIITANRLNADGSSVYMCIVDTTAAGSAESYTVTADGSEIYSGPLHTYSYIYGGVDRDTDTTSVYPNSTIGNWIADSDPNLYLWLTGEEHQLTVNGILYEVTFDAETETLTAEAHVCSYGDNGFCDVCGSYNPEAEGYTVSTAAQLAEISRAVGAGDSFAAKTVTLANDLSLADLSWTPIGGAATVTNLNLTSQEDLDAALQEHFIIYDSTGASYVSGSEKNGTYDSARTYYYQDGAAFAGTFDGAGYTISDLTVNTSAGYAGLFGAVSGTVKDLTVSGSVTSTTSQDFIGGIVGKLCAGGTISGCTNNCEIYAGKAYNIGGVVGAVGEFGSFVSETNPIASVINCTNNGKVSGYVRVGGIAGRNAGLITGCVNHGEIVNLSAAKKGTGGIVGMNGVNNTAVDAGIVTFCYNDGFINTKGGYWCGGIAGFQNAKSYTANCYNAGKLYLASTATGSKWSWINPIVGQDEGACYNCLWINEDTGDNTANYVGKDATGVGCAGNTIAEITGVTSAELKSDSSITALNTMQDSITAGEARFISSCSSYPVLSWQTATEHSWDEGTETAGADCQTAGTITYTCSVCGLVKTEDGSYGAHSYEDNGFCAVCGSYNPDAEGYTVSTAAQLAEIARAVNAGDSLADKTVTIAEDLDLSAYADWTPIGNSTTAFAGTLDGGKHTISGLTITDCTGGYHGLVGNNAGTVKDFTVAGTIGTADAYITSGSDNIGGAVGYNNGTVSGVIARVTIYVNTSKIYAVGGVVGQNGSTGVITECGNEADITGTKAVGGICGRSYNAISSCYNTGAITGNGGGKDGIGGIVGIAGDKSKTYPTTTENCYNTGTISNNNGRWHGGIVGMADGAATVTGCYNVGTIVAGYSWNWNPIIGHVDSYYETVHDNYSLEGLNAGDTTAATQPNTIGTVLSATELKAAAATLGEAYLETCNGYPVLSWQTATEHSWDEGTETAGADCQTAGIITYTCSVCGAQKTADGTLVGSHTAEHHEAVAAACKQDGSIEYWSCSVCGKLFSDEACTTEITEADITVRGLAHSWGEASYEWTATDDGYTVTASIACTREGCSYYPAENPMTETVTAVYAVTAEPTETEAGTGVWTAEFTNNRFSTQTLDEIIPVTACPSAAFTDVNTDAWYHEAIDYVVSAGIMNGTSSDTMKPNSTMTRGMFVTMLYRMAGSPEYEAENPFTDVKTDKYYTNAVLWAYSSDITNGTSATTFEPGKDITRAQMVTFLYRYAQYAGMDVTTGVSTEKFESFDDYGKVTKSYRDAMIWATSVGVIKGDSHNLLNPTSTATRAECAQMFLGFNSWIAGQADPDAA